MAIEDYRIYIMATEDYHIYIMAIEDYHICIMAIEDYHIYIMAIEDYHIYIMAIEDYHIYIMAIEDYHIYVMAIEDYHIYIMAIEDYHIYVMAIEDYHIYIMAIEDYHIYILLSEESLYRLIKRELVGTFQWLAKEDRKIQSNNSNDQRNLQQQISRLESDFSVLKNANNLSERLVGRNIVGIISNILLQNLDKRGGLVSLPTFSLIWQQSHTNDEIYC